jgi:NTE family protein
LFRYEDMTDTSEQKNVNRRPDSKTPVRIGLCLSGGGFRASLFGLGVAGYLAEAGVLGQVDAISAVSGGSVAAAVLADRWPALRADGFTGDAYVRHVIDPFIGTIAQVNLRNRGLARWALRRPLPGGRFGSARGTTMVKHLVGCGSRVVDLPPDLQVVLTSTDLTSNRAFRISQEFVGGWAFGYAPTPSRLGLASALAASTAVPLIFPPVHLRTEGLGLRTAQSELSLLDGGVYDNLGLEWFQGWDRGRPGAARPCDFIIAVDASGPAARADRSFGWVRSVARSQAAQYAQSRASRIRWFVDQLLSGTMQGIYVPIERDPAAFVPPDGTDPIADVADGALPTGFASALSVMRTDLDRFLHDESALLLCHGYWAAHVRLRHLRSDLSVERPTWRGLGGLGDAQYSNLMEVAQAGVSRRVVRRAPAGRNRDQALALPWNRA